MSLLRKLRKTISPCALHSAQSLVADDLIHILCPKMAALGKQPPATAPGQKVNFNALPRPSNYVPGLGRGATGKALLTIYLSALAHCRIMTL